MLPADNKNDWMEVPADVRGRFKIHFVDSISGLLKLALNSER